jgi:phasin family protein
MFATNEQLEQVGKHNIEAALAVAGAQLEALQKLASLNGQLMKTGFETWASNARALAGARDAQEVLEVQSALLQPGIQSTLEYWRDFYGLATEAQGEILRIAARQFAGSGSLTMQPGSETHAALARTKKAA